MRRRFTNSHKTFDYSKYMTIEALEDGYEVYFPRNVEYNLNGHKWMPLKANLISPTLKKGDLLSLRCSVMLGEMFGVVSGNGKAINLRGNILSLLFKDNINLDISGYNAVFQNTFAFYQGNNIISVEKNFLPATTLAHGCYMYMFDGCKNLINAPALPATTLADACYTNMFSNCTSLTVAPELPATTLSTQCYSSMFRGCRELVIAPELPATTLVNFCYQRMFDGCSKLNYIKAMFTTTPSESYTNGWVYGVASSGTFVKNKNASWSVIGDYGIPNGWTVQTS